MILERSIKVGRIEEYLQRRIKDNGAIHITLLDPEKVSGKSASRIAKETELSGTSAIMIGGTTVASSHDLDCVVKAIKREVDIPVILFPNNVNGLSKYADAVWFMSLLNSADPYFLSGAQVLGAPLIKKYGLEPIPLGYIIVGEGGSASVIGRACPIPYNKPDLAIAHALAAQYFGMRFVYLEAGSGVSRSVPETMISAVKRSVDTYLIVGGGIRTDKQAEHIVATGCDIVVTSTIIEESKKNELRIKSNHMVRGIENGAKKRDVK